MSGIAGIVNLDGRPLEQPVLEAMSAALAHRGPDGSGMWRDGAVGLAHRMLHSTPEALHETQPLRDETGQLCLVLDGRIDNRVELKAAIEAAGGRLRDDTDAELVLKSYSCWAEDCPQHLLGDFAFAIWDARWRRLFCARDPLGIKPFFYGLQGTTLAFASEMQPLFAHPAFRRQMNLPLMAMFLCAYYDECEETFYQGVLRLPASHSLRVESGSVRKIRYWDIDPERSIRCRSDQEYAEHFGSLFTDSVRSRLRCPVPMGSTLSGGLDSSSIVSTAAKLYRGGEVPANRLMTFSVVFREDSCDESEYIQAVLRKWGVENWSVTHEDNLSCVDLERAEDYPDVFYEPTRMMFIPAMLEMQSNRVNVLLEGVGGDELMAAGFSHLTDMTRQGKWIALIRQLRSDGANYSVKPSSLFLDFCVRPLVPAPLKRVLRPVLRPLLSRRGPSLVREDFLRATGLEERMQRGFQVPRFPTRAQQTIYNGLFFGWNVLASEMNELFSARFGVECRRPFLDRRLVEFLLAVPEEQRWRGDDSKYVLRQAMHGILPGEVRRRKGKTDFTPTIHRELKDRQSTQVEELFRTAVLAELGVTDAGRLMAMLGEYRAGSRYLFGMVEVAVELELLCRFAMRADKLTQGAYP